MPNHYHLLVRIENDINVSNVLGSFSTSYVKSFNNWVDRTGHLFEGPFQSKLINSDDYLIHVCRYIHLNPVTGGLVNSPESWEHSDYVLWVSEISNNFTEILRRELIGSADDYRRFVMDYAEARAKEAEIEKLLFGST